MTTSIRTVAVLGALALPLAAQAQDITVYGGVTATSNYVFRSVTFSDDDPAIQPYLEVESHGFYAGVWGSNVDFGAGDKEDYEVDVYVGYRGETASGFSYDINYTRFYFNDSGDCCGEIYLTLGMPVTDALSASTEFAYDAPASNLAGGLRMNYDVSDRISVSGLYGYDEAPSHHYWDAGVSYALNDQAALDLRYLDTSGTDAIIAVALSYDLTIFSR